MASNNKSKSGVRESIFIPHPKSTRIKSFGDTPTYEERLHNTTIEQYPDGTTFLSQRPGATHLDDASDTSADLPGRGIFYTIDGREWLVLKNTLYDTNYSGATQSLGGSGNATDKVFFTDIDTQSILVDPANSTGWLLDGSTPTEIVDAVFAALVLKGGVVYLDDYTFVAAGSGRIYNSDLSDPTTWNALGFVTGTREPDNMVAIEKHHDHIIGFGTTTIEFFYNAGNAAPASPLAVRKDLYYNIGIESMNSFDRIKDDVYFVANDKEGSSGVYKLSNFQLTKISDNSLDRYLSARLQGASTDATYVTAFSLKGRDYCVVTTAQLVGGQINPRVSFVWDGQSWHDWALNLTDVPHFGIMGATYKTKNNVHVILTNGDQFSLNMADQFQDSITAGGGTQETNDIDISVTFPRIRLRTNRKKFMDELELVGDETAAAETATVKWADGNSASYNSGVGVAMDYRDKVTRMGAFKNRYIEVSYAINEQYNFEGIEILVSPGTV